MKVEVTTKHSLSVGDDDGNGSWLQAVVDSDGTAQFKLPGSVLQEDENRVQTRWMGREDLLALRALVNKALTYLP